MKLAALILISTLSAAAFANTDELSLNEQVEVEKIEMEATQSSNLKGLFKEFRFSGEDRSPATKVVIAKSK